MSATNCGTVIVANGEIAEALFVSEHTVKSHLKHILTKLDLRDRIHAVVLADETGIVTPNHRTE